MKVCLVLTHQCNLGCSYCYAGEKFAKSMPLEIGFKGLQLAFSKPGPLEISFFGGEPMIAFDALARFTRLAAGWAERRGRELRFAVTTNATILKDKHLRFLNHYNFFVGLSVDGLEDVQDRQRPFVNGRGSGALVWRNLEEACQKLRDFRILMVVRPDNLDGLVGAIERLYRLGASKISLLPETEADWSGHRSHLQEVFGRLARICYLSLMTDEPLLISPFVELHSSRRAPALYSGEESKGGCGFGSDEVAISPAGNFYPCARLVGPDRRAEVQIGSLERGFDLDRIAHLQRQADESMSHCGSGGCKCLALMPGDKDYQLSNVALFTQITGEVCQQAEETLEGVAA